jgi:hypothetical protein
MERPECSSRFLALLIEMTVRDPDGLALIIVEVPPEHPRRRG